MSLIKFNNPDEENGFLSNSFISNFNIHGLCYSSVEQYIAWRKAMYFGDIDTAVKILDTCDSKEIKGYVDSIKIVSDSDWEDVEREVCYNGCYAKFIQNRDLYNKLLSFDKDSVFVYCNSEDKVYGVDVSDSSLNILDGKNLLGDCLSMVRKAIC